MEGHKLLPYLERVRVPNPHRGNCPCGWVGRPASAPELIRGQFAEHVKDEELLDELEFLADGVAAAELALSAAKGIRDAKILEASDRSIPERKIAARAHVSPGRVNQIKSSAAATG